MRQHFQEVTIFRKSQFLDLIIQGFIYGVKLVRGQKLERVYIFRGVKSAGDIFQVLKTFNILAGFTLSVGWHINDNDYINFIFFSRPTAKGWP